MKKEPHLLLRRVSYLKSLFLMTCLLIIATSTLAQTKNVIGTVTDISGEALIGVSILVQGTNNGVVTDLNGKYTLNHVPENATLVVSYIGMLTQEIKVNGQSTINIILKEDSQQLEEIIVIGYGAAKAKDLTAPITVVKGETLTSVPSTTPMAALQGKVPGVNIVNNGAPGEGPTVQIRGIGSFSNSKPLFVVDGMFYDNINFLNNADIQEMSILKDASAAAIYGVRAANGVVLITTKKGARNQKAKITYDGYVGIQKASNVLEDVYKRQVSVRYADNAPYVIYAQNSAFAESLYPSPNTLLRRVSARVPGRSRGGDSGLPPPRYRRCRSLRAAGSRRRRKRGR